MRGRGAQGIFHFMKVKVGLIQYVEPGLDWEAALYQFPVLVGKKRRQGNAGSEADLYILE